MIGLFIAHDFYFHHYVRNTTTLISNSNKTEIVTLYPNIYYAKRCIRASNKPEALSPSFELY